MSCAADVSFLAHFAAHGGALDAARRLFPGAPEPWIDLSTGINPHAYPIGALLPEVWMRLPEAEAVTGLEATAARAYRCHPSLGVVAAPGTQAIIQQLPTVLRGKDVRVLGRTYGEYAAVFAARDVGVTRVEWLEALAGADVAVVVNPNNPDGRLIPPKALARVAGSVGALVVDEAFMDVLEGPWSLAPFVPDGRVIVLRSFGKFYGLAGMRLGFGIAAPEVALDLRRGLGPWAVSGPALAIGTRALSDTDWQTATRARLAIEAGRLDALLVKAGFILIGGTPLFRLARHPRAAALFQILAQAAILTRPFADRPDVLRFGLPVDAPAWDRLERGLRLG